MPLPPEIVAHIYQLATEANLAAFDRARFDTFLAETVNGDTVKRHLTFGAKLGSGKDGLITYILTNRRLIKITIDPPEFKSSAAFINQIIGGVNRKIVSRQSENQADLISISVSFPNGNFGLRYSDDAEITAFFQDVDTTIAEVAATR